MEDIQVAKQESHRYKVTDEQIINALRATKGNVLLSSKSLNYTPQAMYHRLRNNPELRQVLEESREIQIEEADYQLALAVERGEAWAIMFTLRTLGRKRGYGESLTISQKYEKPNPEIDFSKWSSEDIELLDSLFTKYKMFE